MILEQSRRRTRMNRVPFKYRFTLVHAKPVHEEENPTQASGIAMAETTSFDLERYSALSQPRIKGLGRYDHRLTGTGC